MNATDILRIRLHDLADAVYHVEYGGPQTKPIRGVAFATLRERLTALETPDTIAPESHVVSHHEMRNLLTMTLNVLTAAQTGPPLLNVTVRRNVEAPGATALDETFAVPEERAADLLDRIAEAVANNNAARKSIERLRRQALPGVEGA